MFLTTLKYVSLVSMISTLQIVRLMGIKSSRQALVAAGRREPGSSKINGNPLNICSLCKQ